MNGDQWIERAGGNEVSFTARPVEPHTYPLINAIEAAQRALHATSEDVRLVEIEAAAGYLQMAYDAVRGQTP